MGHNFPFNHFLRPKTQDHSSQNREDRPSGFVGQQSLFPDLLINKSPKKKGKEKSLDFSEQEEIKTPQSDIDDDLKDISEEIIRLLEKALPPHKFGAFFKNNFKLMALDETKAVFTVGTAFVQSILQKNYLKIIQDNLEQLIGRTFDVEIVLSTQSLKKESLQFLSEIDEIGPPAPQKKSINHMNPSKNSGLIDANKTFDNFIIGPSNNMAFATAKAVAETPGKRGKYPSLYIYSGSGLGKTHLLHSVGNELKIHHPELVVCLITAREFMNEMVEAIQAKQLNEFHKKYSEKVDVLMIDDIHELKGKTGTQNQFFHIFNELHSKGKQLIFTSDKSPEEIDGIEERIKTRLQWGLVLDIQRPDIETRIAIIKEKAYDLDLFINDDILHLVASSVKSSIRELEGCLIKLKAHSDLFSVEIDTETAKNVLALHNFNGEKKITLETITKATAQFFKIPLPDLVSRSRNKDITRARHIAMYLSRKVIHATQIEIGEYFGGRDHTSVIHAIRTVGQKLKTDSQLSKDLFEIESLF